MRTMFTRFGAALALATFVAALLAAGAPAPAAAHPSIDLSVSNWKFVPAKITIPVGEPTTLRITSTQGVHGIKSDELGIPQTTIGKGQTVTVIFTPKKTGTYVIHCSVFCGPGHPDMKITVVVTDPS